MPSSEQSELFRNSIESLLHPFYVIDAESYRIVYANRAAAAIGTLSDDSTCYAHGHNRRKPCSSTEQPCPLQIVKETKRPVTLEHIHYDRHGDARQVEVHCYPVFDDAGNVIQMIEYDLDITERRRMEEELQESKERFRSVLISAHDAIISIDSRGSVVFWNEAARKMFGYEAPEMVGRSVSIIMPKRFRERHRKGMRRVIATGETRIIGRTVELAGLRKDGVEFPLELSLARWETKKGIYFTGILRDITERKRAEEELRIANERMKRDLEAAARAQQSLLPGDSHEIRGVRVAHAFEPCEELGGDIFNVFQLDERHMGVYILDVSGHGVPAALLAVTLSHMLSPVMDSSSLLKQQAEGAAEYHLIPPTEVAARLNRQFPMDPEKLQYFTLLYGILDLETLQFRYVSAGHAGPIHLARDPGATVLEKRGFPIGWFEEVEYEEYTICMQPGDRLYLYSDGIIEAVNAEGDQFGESQLIDSIVRSRNIPLEDGISSVLMSVDDWRGGAKLIDDVSVLAFEIAKTHGGLTRGAAQRSEGGSAEDPNAHP